MKIAISTETTSDLTKEMIAQYDIKTIAFQITLGDKEFHDGELTTQEMFDYVDKTGILPKTTALNEFEYTEYFENILKEYDAVIHICLSSKISCTCSNAMRAAENVKNAYVVDSKSLSTGIALLALHARDLANQGVEPEKIQQICQERADKVQASFSVERLDYLYKGGRCSAVARFGANLLHLRPRIVLQDGKMGSDKKYRGPMGKVIEKYCADVLEDFNKPDLERVFITYTSATEEMLNAARTACENAGFKNIYQTFAGGTIASHCGPNTLGIIYINDAE